MFQSPPPTQNDRALQRLRLFDLHEGQDPDFEIAFSILSPRARDVAIAYTDHYMATIKPYDDPDEREAFIVRVTAGFKARYDVPVGVDWIKKGEQLAHSIHKRGTDPADHLSALSVAQAKEVMVVFEGIEDPEEGIRIAAKMSRLQALDAEILLNTVKELQTQRHFSWVQKEVGNFHGFLGTMVQDTAKSSEASKRDAEDAKAQTEELVELSDSVSQAALASADAMSTAALEASQLGDTLDQIMAELSRASDTLRNAKNAGDDAVATVDALGEKSSSIESIAALIEDITDRSDVLALNASIEAAHAGDIGAGFGVVASEMKALAEKTALATKDLFSHVEAIKSAREEALAANRSMLLTFANVSEMTAAVRSTVGEKSQAVIQISQRIDQTADNVAQAHHSISSINGLAVGLTERVTKTGGSLESLSSQIKAVKRGTDEFLSDLARRADFEKTS